MMIDRRCQPSHSPSQTNKTYTKTKAKGAKRKPFHLPSPMVTNPNRTSNVRMICFKAISSAFPSHSECGIVNTTVRPKHTTNHTATARDRQPARRSLLLWVLWRTTSKKVYCRLQTCGMKIKDKKPGEMMQTA